MRFSKLAVVAMGALTLSGAALAQPVSYAPSSDYAPQGGFRGHRHSDADLMAFALIAAMQGATLALVARGHGNRTVVNVYPSGR